ncbi:restriction endonuclease subunit S, partial [Paenibacillus sp. MCAF20]
IVGEYPQHWKLKRLKEILSVSSGESANIVDVDFRVGLYPVYGGNGIMGYTDGYNNVSDILVIGRVGAKCGNVHYVKEKAWVSDNALVAKSKLNKFFLEYALNSMNLNRLSSANAQPLITGSLIKNQFIAIPDKHEASEIADYLNTKTGQIDRKLDLLTQKVTHYEKLKLSLINETVTGGLDKNVVMKN